MNLAIPSLLLVANLCVARPVLQSDPSAMRPVRRSDSDRFTNIHPYAHYGEVVRKLRAAVYQALE